MVEFSKSTATLVELRGGAGAGGFPHYGLRGLMEDPSNTSGKI